MVLEFVQHYCRQMNIVSCNVYIYIRHTPSYRTRSRPITVLIIQRLKYPPEDFSRWAIMNLRKRAFPICTTIGVLLWRTTPFKNKIKIRPIDALLEVLGFTTFSIYLVFQFELLSYLSDTLIWVKIQFLWHSNLSDIIVWVTF